MTNQNTNPDNNQNPNPENDSDTKVNNNVDPNLVSSLQARINELEQSQGIKDGQIAEIAKGYRELLLEFMPADKKVEVTQMLADLEKRASESSISKTLEERAKELTAKELALEYKDFGVTTEELLKAKSPTEMEAVALRAKATFLENKTNGNNGNNGNVNGTGADPSKMHSDKGTSSSSGAPTPKIEGKGREAVSDYLAGLFREKHTV